MAHRLWTLALTVAGVATACSIASAQPIVYVSRDVHNAPPDVSLTYPSTPACSVPDGGFVPTSSSLRVDAVVTWDASAFYGFCDEYLWGQYYTTQTRYINTVKVTEGGGWLNFAVPLGATTYDSKASGGTLTWSTGSIGEHSLSVTTWGMSTNCLIPMYDSNSVRTVNFNTVACAPEWNYSQNYPGQVIHEAQTTISFYITTDLWDRLVGTVESPGPAQRAVDDWNTAMTGLGLTFQVVNSNCGTAGNCIDLQVASLAPACGKYITYVDSSGAIN